jgi:quercetin dioxygenase-like cupin family protein
MASAWGKNMDAPDEVREFEKGRMDVARSDDGVMVGRTVLQPGWRWSEHVKPVAGTDSCQANHVGYVVAGRIKIVMDDGQELDLAAGDAYRIPPGHDAWVVGDEEYVGVDVTGAATGFAKTAD